MPNNRYQNIFYNSKATIESNHAINEMSNHQSSSTSQSNQSSSCDNRRVNSPSISQDTKERFVQFVQSNPGDSILSAAKVFGLAASTAYAILRRYETNGTTASKPRGGARICKMTPPAVESLSEWLELQPDLTLGQLSEKLVNSHSIAVSKQAISRALTRNGFTVKLLRTIPISRNCQSTLQSRKEYAQKFLGEAPSDTRNIIWIDECGFNLHIRRKFGRARMGRHASIEVPNSRGANISACAATSCEGFLYERFRPGAYNAVSFCEYLQELFEVLCIAGRTQCWIILDNVCFHHCEVVRACVAQSGHILSFLPPYSPMLNPIESLFGKWKGLIRTQHVTFTRDSLLQSMASSRVEISMEDCQGWIRDMNRNIGLSLLGHIFE
jgi:transposase